jgi:hypothetical protein
MTRLALRIRHPVRPQAKYAGQGRIAPDQGLRHAAAPADVARAA